MKKLDIGWKVIMAGVIFVIYLVYILMIDHGLIPRNWYKVMFKTPRNRTTNTFVLNNRMDVLLLEKELFKGINIIHTNTLKLNITIVFIDEDSQERIIITEGDKKIIALPDGNNINELVTKLNADKQLSEKMKSEAKAAEAYFYYKNHGKNGNIIPIFTKAEFNINYKFKLQAYARELSALNYRSIAHTLEECLNKNIKNAPDLIYRYNQVMKDKTQYSKDEILSLSTGTFIFRCFILCYYPLLKNQGASEKVMQGMEIWHSNFSQQFDPMVAYAPFVVEKYYLANYIEDVCSTIVIILFFSLVLYFLQFWFRRSLYTIIKEELYQNGITVNQRIIRKIIWKYWRIWFFSFKDEKSITLIKEHCRELRYKIGKREYSRKAYEIWKNVKNTLDPQNPEYGMAEKYFDNITKAGKKSHNLDRIEREYLLLLSYWQKLKRRARLKREEEKQPAATTKKKRLDENHLTDKEKVLETAEEMLKGKKGYQLNNWSKTEISNLIVVLSALNGIHSQAEKAFELINDPRNLLTENSVFMNAIRTNDKKIIQKKLGMRKTERVDTLEQPDYSTVLKDFEVILIGGGKCEPKKLFLCDAIKKLGAIDCTFVNNNEDRRFHSAINSNLPYLFIAITADISHSAYYAVKRRAKRNGKKLIQSHKPSEATIKRDIINQLVKQS